VALKAARNAEGLLTVDEARRRLAVSRSTLYLLMREGRLRFIHVGRSRRIEVEALCAFLEEQWVEPAERITHGRRYAYQVGCRCDACRTAWNDYHRTARERRSANLEQVWNGLQHGTVSTYKNHGCRCDACARAGSRANKRRPSRTVRPDRRLIS
jgi:excisionase family DNA binding protein